MFAGVTPVSNFVIMKQKKKLQFGGTDENRAEIEESSILENNGRRRSTRLAKAEAAWKTMTTTTTATVIVKSEIRDAEEKWRPKKKKIKDATGEFMSLCKVAAYDNVYRKKPMVRRRRLVEKYSSARYNFNTKLIRPSFKSISQRKKLLKSSSLIISSFRTPSPCRTFYPADTNSNETFCAALVPPARPVGHGHDADKSDNHGRSRDEENVDNLEKDRNEEVVNKSENQNRRDQIRDEKNADESDNCNHDQVRDGEGIEKDEDYRCPIDHDDSRVTEETNDRVIEEPNGCATEEHNGCVIEEPNLGHSLEHDRKNDQMQEKTANDAECPDSIGVLPENDECVSATDTKTPATKSKIVPSEIYSYLSERCNPVAPVGNGEDAGKSDNYDRSRDEENVDNLDKGRNEEVVNESENQNCRDQIRNEKDADESDNCNHDQVRDGKGIERDEDYRCTIDHDNGRATEEANDRIIEEPNGCATEELNGCVIEKPNLDHSLEHDRKNHQIQEKTANEEECPDTTDVLPEHDESVFATDTETPATKSKIVPSEIYSYPSERCNPVAPVGHEEVADKSDNHDRSRDKENVDNLDKVRNEEVVNESENQNHRNQIQDEKDADESDNCNHDQVCNEEGIEEDEDFSCPIDHDDGSVTEAPSDRIIEEPNGCAAEEPNDRIVEEPNGCAAEEPINRIIEEPNGCATEDNNGCAIKEPNVDHSLEMQEKTANDEECPDTTGVLPEYDESVSATDTKTPATKSKIVPSEMYSYPSERCNPVAPAGHGEDADKSDNHDQSRAEENVHNLDKVRNEEVVNESENQNRSDQIRDKKDADESDNCNHDQLRDEEGIEEDEDYCCPIDHDDGRVTEELNGCATGRVTEEPNGCATEKHNGCVIEQPNLDHSLEHDRKNHQIRQKTANVEECPDTTGVLSENDESVFATDSKTPATKWKIVPSEIYSYLSERCNPVAPVAAPDASSTISCRGRRRRKKSRAIVVVKKPLHKLKYGKNRRKTFRDPYVDALNQATPAAENATENAQKDDDNVGMVLHLGVNRPLFPLVYRNIVALNGDRDTEITDLWANFALSTLINDPSDKKVTSVFLPVKDAGLLSVVDEYKNKLSVEFKEIELQKVVNTTTATTTTDTVTTTTTAVTTTTTASIVQSVRKVNPQPPLQRKKRGKYKKRKKWPWWPMKVKKAAPGKPPSSSSSPDGKGPVQTFKKRWYNLNRRHSSCCGSNSTGSGNHHHDDDVLDNLRSERLKNKCRLINQMSDCSVANAIVKIEHNQFEEANYEQCDSDEQLLQKHGYKPCFVLVPKLPQLSDVNNHRIVERVATPVSGSLRSSPVKEERIAYTSPQQTVSSPLLQWSPSIEATETKIKFEETFRFSDHQFTTLADHRLTTPTPVRALFPTPPSLPPMIDPPELHFFGYEHCSRTYGPMFDYVARNRSLVFFYKIKRILKFQNQNNKLFKSCCYVRMCNNPSDEDDQFADVTTVDALPVFGGAATRHWNSDDDSPVKMSHINGVEYAENSVSSGTSGATGNADETETDEGKREETGCPRKQPAWVNSSYNPLDILKSWKISRLEGPIFKDFESNTNKFSIGFVDNASLRTKSDVKWFILRLNRSLTTVIYGNTRVLPVELLHQVVYRADLTKKVVCNVIDEDEAALAGAPNDDDPLKFGVYGVPGFCEAVLLGPYPMHEKQHCLTAVLKLPNNEITEAGVLEFSMGNSFFFESNESRVNNICGTWWQPSAATVDDPVAGNSSASRTGDLNTSFLNFLFNPRLNVSATPPPPRFDEKIKIMNLLLEHDCFTYQKYDIKGKEANFVLIHNGSDSSSNTASSRLAALTSSSPKSLVEASTEVSRLCRLCVSLLPDDFPKIPYFLL